MKKIRRLGLAWSLLCLTLVMLLASSGLLAYTLLKSIPVNIEIIPGEISLDIYSAASPDAPLDGIKIANFRRGTSHTLDLLVKNTGQETLTPRFSIEPAAPSWGTITADPADFTGTLGPGVGLTLSITITVPITTSTGDVSFEIQFYEP